MKKIKIKNIIKNIKEFLVNNKYIIYMPIPLILMDIFTVLFSKKIDLTISNNSHILFSTTWIILFTSLSLLPKKKIGKKIYININILFLISYIVNNIYYSITKTYFDFSLLESTSEGIPYVIDALINTNILIYISIIMIIICIKKSISTIPYKTKNKPIKYAVLVFLIFTLSHILIPYTLGNANASLTWSSWKNPRNIYNSFNDNNKSMKISGLYEYTLRNFYITYIKPEKPQNEEDIDFLNQIYIDNKNNTNKYTGLLKDKNLIFIQLEGIDNWLINENTTPTLYKLMNNSINFNNHYSYYNGGGSTFNSEFAVNTGFITPLSYTQNAYTFNKNYFPYSLANIYKQKGYKVNAFHMNNGEYYSRKVNYNNWGYNNYYGLIDMYDYPDNKHQLDRELILNEEYSNLMFDKDNLFLDYIITYSNHLPFSSQKGVCKKIIELENNNQETENIENIEATENTEDIILTEEECIKKQAKETDYFIELLLNKLEENSLLENTALIIFTDHYLYTVKDKTILEKYKQADNNLINKTPFFIWSKDIEKETINKVTSQLNILPTVLNLSGISYNKNNYISTDALDKDYKGIVFFSDYSWYDGTVYVENGEVKNNKYIDQDKLEETNYNINNLIRKNDLTLKYNYLKILQKKEKVTN